MNSKINDERMGDLKLVVSCIPGLEHVTVAECKEKLVVKAKRGDQRGRVSFLFPLDNDFIEKLKDLRSIHHIWVVVGEISDFIKTGDTKEKSLNDLEEMPLSFSWENPLTAHKTFRRNANGKKSSSSTESEIHDKINHSHSAVELLKTPTRTESDGVIKFRVTCSRTGKHQFNSMEAAKWIGSGVKGMFDWQVDLENFDIEVLAFIIEHNITLAIRLTEESKHNRNITHFGPTTLRSTTSYCMLKLAGIKPGEIVCDPMCGTGSISLEAVNSFPSSFQLAGELHPDGCDNAGENFHSLCTEQGINKNRSNYSLPFDILRWDVCHLPVRTESVDVIVCDLPFGKKIGSRSQNKTLYTNALKEMGRICRSGTSRAVFITQHKNAMIFAIRQCKYLWKRRSLFHINMGGLNVAVYVLARKAIRKHKFKNTEQNMNEQSDENEECSDENEVGEN